MQAAQSADVQAEEAAAGQKARFEQLVKDVERAKLSAKEEEEKRVKAISLLKTVRQKLVKAEKEKEDAMKESLSWQEKDKGEKEREYAERVKLRNELDAANAEKEKAIAGLKAQFDKEIANFKDRSEKEMSATQGHYELELASTKVSPCRHNQSPFNAILEHICARTFRQRCSNSFPGTSIIPRYEGQKHLL